MDQPGGNLIIIFMVVMFVMFVMVVMVGVMFTLVGIEREGVEKRLL